MDAPGPSLLYLQGLDFDTFFRSARVEDDIVPLPRKRLGKSLARTQGAGHGGMGATYLKWDLLAQEHATELPIKVCITACDPQGHVDTSKAGKLSLLVCKSLCDDTFSTREIQPWIACVDGPTCDVVPKSPGEGDPGSTHCLQIKGGVGDAKMDRNWAKGIKRNLGQIRPTRLWFHVKTNTSEHESGVLFLTDGSDRVCTVFALRDGGRMGIEDELIHYSRDVRTSFQAHTWYGVTLLFDWSSQVFDLLVDGIVVGTRIPFEDRMVHSLGFAYISNSHEASETLWDRFQCADEACVPNMELDGEAYMVGGIWHGHMTFDVPADLIFVTAQLEQQQLGGAIQQLSSENSASNAPCAADGKSGANLATSILQNDAASLRQGHPFRTEAVSNQTPRGRSSIDSPSSLRHVTRAPDAAGDPVLGADVGGSDQYGGRIDTSGGGSGGGRRAEGVGPLAVGLMTPRAPGGRITAEYALQEAERERKREALAVIRSAPFCSGLHGRSGAISLRASQTDVIAAGNRTRLMRDYLALLDDKSMSDLTLVVQGRNIYVHKAMLAARSSHFKNMLSSGMRECEDGQVLMPDAPYEAMKSLLVYLYSGDAPLTPDSAMPVLRLADRYMVTGLKRLCESVLVSAISKESIVALLEAAFRYSAEHLAAACLEYCVQHFAELVLTEEYMNLDAALMIKVQQAVAPHVCRPRLSASTTHHHGLALMPQIFCAPGRSSHS